MKLFLKRTIAIDHLFIPKIISYIALYKFSNACGWCFWTHLISILKYNNTFLFMLFPAWNTPLWVWEINL
jgi:hypothetical protein